MATTQSTNSQKQQIFQSATVDVAQIRAAQIRLIVGHLMEQTATIGWSELAGPHRGSAKAKRARRIAMYLAHVGGGLTLTATGALFERDRRTVAHAAAAVEDDREIDRRLDRILEVMERAVRLSLARARYDA